MERKTRKSNVSDEEHKNPPTTGEISILPLNSPIDMVHPERERQDSETHPPGTDSGDGVHTHSWINSILKMEDEKAIRIRKELKEQIKDILLSKNNLTNKNTNYIPKNCQL